MICYICTREVKLIFIQMGEEQKKKKAGNPKTFMTSILYEDRIDLIKKMLVVYNAIADLKKWPVVCPRHIDLVSYYICYGYSDNTKRLFIENFGKNSNSVSVMDSELKSRGLLVDKGGNYKTRDLSDRLKAVRAYFASGTENEKYFRINFARND